MSASDPNSKIDLLDKVNTTFFQIDDAVNYLHNNKNEKYDC